MDSVNREKAVCLLSGGLDSATAAYVAAGNYKELIALTVDYGQRHSREINSAREIAKRLKIEHLVVSLPLPWGGSSLLDVAISLPKNRSGNQMSKNIPSSYVAARNTILLSFAASLAEARAAGAIFIGANAVDYSGYPDCRPEYFQSAQKTLQLGTKCGVEGRPIAIETPLISMTKAEIIRLGVSLGVPYELTWSCYEGGERPCLECDSCRLRIKGFQDLGIQDPILTQFVTADKND